MANCVLCGKKVGILDQIKLDFHGTKQIVCSDCDRQLQHASPKEREALGKQILESPHLQEREMVHANVNTGKICSACGATLECRLRNFFIGQDGYGGLSSLGLPSYEVDLFSCPRCGKIELYDAQFSSQFIPEEEPEEPVTCPVCGTKHSPRIGCPSCAARMAASGQRPKPPKTDSSRPGRWRKPPWEK